MKNIKLFAIIALAIGITAFHSCKKDNETENENQVVAKSANDESRELLNRIYAFQALRDNVRSGVKSGESMTLEQLRDDIDLTFNYEHSQHALPFTNVTLDTFYVRMPQVDANGNVSATEAIATYNAFETELSELMAGVDDDSNLAKNFSIKFPETGAKSGDAIEVVFTRGEKDFYPQDGGPFKKGDDFIWGGMLGYCDPDPTARATDAANELTRKFQNSDDDFHLISNVEYAGYKAYDDNDIFLSGYIYYEDTTLTCGHTWLFVYSGDDDPCIPYNEMNCYWNHIIKNVVSINGPLHYGPKTGYPYYECMIDDKIIYDSKRPVKMHTLWVTYINIVPVNE